MLNIQYSINEMQRNIDTMLDDCGFHHYFALRLTIFCVFQV
jgi:hypothetical protein